MPKNNDKTPVTGATGQIEEDSAGAPDPEIVFARPLDFEGVEPKRDRRSAFRNVGRPTNASG